MTMYVVWHKDHDNVVRAAYEYETGEAIEQEPHTNGTLYIVGTSRATREQLERVPHITWGVTPENAGYDV